MLLSLTAAILSIITVLHLPTISVASANISTKLDSPLQSALSIAKSDEPIRVIIHVTGEANLSALTLSSNVISRREQVIALLQETAVSAQASLLTTLAGLQTNGDVVNYRSFWINNSIAVTGNADAINQLSRDPSVTVITLDAQRRYFEEPEEIRFNLIQAAAPLTSSVKSWGIDQILAPAVWHGLGVDGTGITVAIMDSGVDYLHPDLLPNYRGNLGNNTFDHSGNWFFTSNISVTEPIDAFGHGTHVAGTAVGQNGIGVAPGAKWIAVGLTDESGFIFDSDIHAGFQWLLAPAGNPALAPDVVNNSWGASGTQTIFYEDIEVLQAAGIITVFSAGNNGPYPSTIGIPASYTNTIAIGASDEIDEVAWFSSRGPSRLTNDLHPHLVAPGTLIYSSVPGGGYALANGTSMAAPHTTGAIALILAANPTLTRAQVLAQLQDTAVSIAPTHPNTDSGWGRLNVYEAVKPYVTHGKLQGIVMKNSVPLPGILVTVTTTAGKNIPFVTNGAGQFQADLLPGSYTITTAPFAYVPQSVSNLVVVANQSTNQNIHLTGVPQGIIRGTVVDKTNNIPLAGAVVTVAGMPITAVTDAYGYYALSIPEQQAKITISAAGYRLAHATHLPTAAEPILHNFALTPTASILVVDAGQWVFASEITYYEDALTALGYAYDLWSIRHPVDGVPTSADLIGYDVVLWADPYYAPGVLEANDAVVDYLKAGGNLFISGQNVAAYDGGTFSKKAWWTKYLGGSYLGKTAVSQLIFGADNTTFSGLSLSLNGGSSAQNQSNVDQSQPGQQPFMTDPVFYYGDGTIAGLQAGSCKPYHLVYLGFGLEGVSESAQRIDIVDRTFDFFDAPQTVIGSRWEDETIEEFALPGSKLVYTVTLRNLSETLTDTFTISAASEIWNTKLVTKTLTLGPCQTGETAVSITVPSNAAHDSYHLSQITAVSAYNPYETSSLTLQHKTPGDILLVDDDRWYDQQALFKAQLDSMNLQYDVWDMSLTQAPADSPSTAFLNEYQFVIWFTGYDWFAPVTYQERQSLTAYLQNGGRLFLNSQDFLYYHWQSPLAADYFGVIDYRESISPTAVYAGHRPDTSSAIAGPLMQTYGPYLNFSDGIVPGPQAVPLYWHNAGFPAAIATEGENHRAVLMSLPLETLTETVRPLVMNDIVGWLGDLGDSSFSVDRRSGAAGAARTYTLTIRNTTLAPMNWVTAVNSLPVGLIIDVNSITGGAIYNPSSHELTWSGSLTSGNVHQIRYKATPDNSLPPDTMLENKVNLKYDRHQIAFNRFATMWIASPDLSQSTLTVQTNQLYAATAVTYTFNLHNSGIAATSGLTTAWVLPDRYYSITPTVTASSGSFTLLDGTLVWQGDLNPGEAMSATVAFTRTASTAPVWIPTAVVINDGVTSTLLRENQLVLWPYSIFFPLLADKK